MLNHAVGSALGFLILSFMTWSITFAFLVFGVMLRRKILLWDDHWKETVEQTGITIGEFAEDLERTYQKVRGTFRLLGFFLVVIAVLMGFVAYLGLLEKPVLGVPQVMSGLWLLVPRGPLRDPAGLRQLRRGGLLHRNHAIESQRLCLPGRQGRRPREEGEDEDDGKGQGIESPA